MEKFAAFIKKNKSLLLLCVYSFVTGYAMEYIREMAWKEGFDASSDMTVEWLRGLAKDLSETK